MNPRTAEQYLPCYRAGKRIDARTVKAAVRLAERDPALRRKLSDQMDFDDQLVDVLHCIKPPEDLRKKLSALSARPGGEVRRLRSQWAHPAILSAFIGMLLIVGFLVHLEMASLSDFPGKEAVERMISSTQAMTGAEFEPANAPVAQLGDWFYVHGYENFAFSPEVGSLPVVGSRVFRLNGRPIAQMAIDRENALLYTFRASDFGVDLALDKGWSFFEQDGWAAAIRSNGAVCTMLAFRGTKEEMEQFVKSLEP